MPALERKPRKQLELDSREGKSTGNRMLYRFTPDEIDVLAQKVHACKAIVRDWDDMNGLRWWAEAFSRFKPPDEERR
jgi:hypothetical protein